VGLIGFGYARKKFRSTLEVCLLSPPQDPLALLHNTDRRTTPPIGLLVGFELRQHAVQCSHYLHCKPDMAVGPFSATQPNPASHSNIIQYNTIY